MKIASVHKPNVLAICCSARDNGINANLIKSLRDKQSSLAMTVLMLSHKNISPCNSCGECAVSGRCSQIDDFDSIVESITAHDAIIVFSPVYKSGVPSKLRALIERTTVLRHFTANYEEKSLGVVVTGKLDGVGKLTAADDILHFATSLGFLIVPPIVFGHVLPNGDVLLRDELMASLEHLLKRIEHVSNCITNKPIQND